MTSLDEFAWQHLTQLEQKGLRRRLVVTEPEGGVTVKRDGESLINFSGNDYLNLSQNKSVKRSATKAIEQYGAGAGASRLVTGNHPLFEKLEGELARVKRTQAALVFGSGYLANIGVIPALVGKRDTVFADELAHACIHGGMKLSGASTYLFRHNDTAHLEELLLEHRNQHGNALVITETVFSMDGDRAPIAELSRLAKTHDAWLMTDDAHGLGLGLQHEQGVDVPLQMGTLSKAAGSYGGYLCASRNVIDLLVSRARSFVYTTGLPPASVAASLTALQIMRSNPGYVRRPIQRARVFTEALGLPPPQSAIVPVLIGDADKAMAISSELKADGFLVVAIRPPTVPEGTARLRLTFSPEHKTDDIRRLAQRVKHHMSCHAIS